MLPEALAGPFAQQQKILLYVFPLVFAIGGINFPVGVLIYWFTSNLWTMGQQFYVIRRNPAPGTPAYDAWEARRKSKGKGVALAPAIEPEPAPETATPNPTKVVGQQPRQQPRKQPRSQAQALRLPSTGDIRWATSRKLKARQLSRGIWQRPSRGTRPWRILSTSRRRSPLITSKSCSTLPTWTATSTHRGDRTHVSIISESTVLVGPAGAVLDALQELTRLAVMTETGERSQLMLDVAGYRERRRKELEALAATRLARPRSLKRRCRWHP